MERLSNTANAVLVYQDTVARQRAMGLWDRVTQLVGEKVARCAAWSFAELTDANVLGKAAAAAIQAEVIVVAAHAAHNLPCGLVQWVNAWLHGRRQDEGALIAVICRAAQSDASPDQVEPYLRQVAHETRLDFLLQEHHTTMSSVSDVNAALTLPRSSLAP